jgi:hypothetical protein
VLLITSDSLTGRFFFDTNAQAQNAGDTSDVQKRTADYFKFLLYTTAVLSIIRCVPSIAGLISDSRDVWFIFQNLAFCSAVGASNRGVVGISVIGIEI